jgi:hypothetical protein
MVADSSWPWAAAEMEHITKIATSLQIQTRFSGETGKFVMAAD